MPNPQNLKPFQKGHDKRRNTKGRPKSFDKLRALAVQLSHEEITDKKTGDTLTVVEAVLRTLAKENPVRVLEIAYGKVPDVIENKGQVTIKVKREDK